MHPIVAGDSFLRERVALRLPEQRPVAWDGDGRLTRGSRQQAQFISLASTQHTVVLFERAGPPAHGNIRHSGNKKVCTF